MKLELKNIRANVKESKLEVEFEHEFKPLKDEEVIVVCDYLKNGEIASLMDEDGTPDINKVFKKKAKEIKGLILEIDGKEVKATPEMLVDLPMGIGDEATRVVTEIILATFGHIISGATLTKDEVKN